MPEDRRKFGEFSALVEAFDGQTHWFEKGFHATFRFWIGKPGAKRAHPYRYELVLHDPQGRRILGYDNAHPVKWKSGQFMQRDQHPDHFHRDRSDKGRPYAFVSLTQLLEDFYEKTEQALAEFQVSANILAIQPTAGHDNEH